MTNKQDEKVRRKLFYLRKEINEMLVKAKVKKIVENKKQGKRKAYKDKEKVFLPADNGRIMVAMDSK